MTSYPKLTPRGKKNFYHFRPCFEGKQQSWVNLKTAKLGEAKRKQVRFMSLMSIEGFDSAKSDLTGKPIPATETKKITIEKMIELYQSFNESNGNLYPVKESTLKTYIYTLKKIAKAANASEFQDLEGLSVIEVTQKINPNASRNTIANNLRVIRAFTKPTMKEYLKKCGYEVKDPFEGQQVKVDKVASYEPFSSGKQKEIWNNCLNLPKSQAMIVRMALGIGLRRQEIEFAQKSWFYEQDGNYFCKAQKVKPPIGDDWLTKSKESRTIPIPKKLFMELQELRTSCADFTEETEWFVPGVRGRVPDSRLHADFCSVLKWLKEQGLSQGSDPKLIHVLRKQYGSCIAQEHGIHIASVYLGHSGISVTEKHYVGLLNRPVGDVMKA